METKPQSLESKSSETIRQAVEKLREYQATLRVIMRRTEDREEQNALAAIILTVGNLADDTEAARIKLFGEHK